MLFLPYATIIVICCFHQQYLNSFRKSLPLDLATTDFQYESVMNQNMPIFPIYEETFAKYIGLQNMYIRYISATKLQNIHRETKLREHISVSQVEKVTSWPMPMQWL